MQDDADFKIGKHSKLPEALEESPAQKTGVPSQPYVPKHSAGSANKGLGTIIAVAVVIVLCIAAAVIIFFFVMPKGHPTSQSSSVEVRQSHHAKLSSVSEGSSQVTQLEPVDEAFVSHELETYALQRGTRGVAYKVVDIDGDALPELLISQNSSNSLGALCLVCAYDAQARNVIELCSAAGGDNEQPGIWYSENSHEVAFLTERPDGSTYAFYSIGPGSAKKEFSYMRKGNGPDYSYAFEGQEISKSSYDEMLDTLAGFNYLPSPNL